MIDRNAILKTIAIPLMSQCVANTKILVWGDKERMHRLFINRSCMISLFNWSYSPQGDTYWRRWCHEGRVGGLVNWND